MRQEDSSSSVPIDTAPSRRFVPLSAAATATAAAVAAIGYIVSLATPNGAAAILVALPAFCVLSRQRTTWIAFVIGLATGLANWASLVAFIFTIFGAFSLVLWLLGAMLFGVFTGLLNVAHRWLGPYWAMCLTPMFWAGCEYFRSEVWPLRCAWLLPGQAPAFLPG